jgi:sterol desaturase/sphingolipid hydroxylase (fatty acid hydroxylase superfamily)
LRDLVGTIAGSVAAPFLFLTGPTHRLYWLYLLSAAAMAVALYLCRHGGRRAFRACIAFLLPKAIYAHRSSFLDYRFFYVNTAVFSMILGPVVGSSTIAGAIARACGADTAASAGPLVTAALTLSILLAMDLALYFGHWLQHRIPVLWEFHKVHHSAEVLTPVTAFRAHPVDDLLNLTLTAASTGIVQGIFEAAYGTQIVDMRILGVNALLFAWYVSGFNLRHSHIWLSYPRWLSHIVISPAQHQIHHSKAPRHFDKNMGFIFACWDALFGTLYVPAGREELGYGLSGDEHLRFASVPTLYLRPFVSLWRKYGRRLRPRPSLLQ